MTPPLLTVQDWAPSGGDLLRDSGPVSCGAAQSCCSGLGPTRPQARKPQPCARSAGT